MSARYVIARGAAPDEAFETIEAVACRLLDLVDEEGHGEATLLLRHGNAARRQVPAGPCLALSILDEVGGWRVYGFAYVFVEPTLPGDAHLRLENAMREARPLTFKPPRQIPWPREERAA